MKTGLSNKNLSEKKTPTFTEKKIMLICGLQMTHSDTHRGVNTRNQQLAQMSRCYCLTCVNYNTS